MERRSRHLGSASDSERRVDRMITRHGPALLRVARHFSLCQDDALDAYQRGLEIYLRRLESLDPATELGWLKVVIRHEAMAVRRDRQADVGAEDPDLDARVPGEQRSVDDRIASSERSSRSAEALRHLKADEAKALMLKAQGHSYREIGEQLGWTYTKTNRAITEGRARFMRVFGRIEAGEECERFAPVLIAMVAGRAGADALIEIRPHLRHCARCRATIRTLHLSRRDRAAALIPLPVLVPLRWIGAKLGIGGGGHGAALDAAGGANVHPEAPPGAESTLDAPTLPEGPDALGSSDTPQTGDATTLDGADSLNPPQAGDSAAPDALDGLGTPELPQTGDPTTPAHQPDVEELAHRFDGMTTPSGVQHATAATEHASSAAEHAEHLGRLHPLQLKQDIYGLFHRFQASDVATGVQLAGTGGGGRGTAIAALIGFCFSSVGAGAYCVATGVLPDPVGIIRQDDRPADKAKAEPPKRRMETKLANLPDPAEGAAAAPTTHRTQRPHRRRHAPAGKSSASQQRRTPTAHEQPVTSPPAQGSTGEFNFEQTAPASRPAPAPAPATGGSEFRP